MQGLGLENRVDEGGVCIQIKGFVVHGEQTGSYKSCSICLLWQKKMWCPYIP